MSMATTVYQTLEEIITLLTDDSFGCSIDPVCRAGVYPGAQAAWDSCGDGPCGDRDGQLWGLIQSITPRTGDPGCREYSFTAQLGIVRCAAVVQDDGTPPPIEAVSQDALRQAQDADAIRYAIECCPQRSERVRDIIVGSWTALGPSGGCVGGAWTIEGRHSVCC